MHLQVTVSVSILNQINPVHASPSRFLKIHFNVIFLSISRSSKWLFPSGLSTKYFYAHFIFPVRATCTGHHILLYLNTRIMNIWLGAAVDVINSKRKTQVHVSVESRNIHKKCIKVPKFIKNVFHRNINLPTYTAFLFTNFPQHCRCHGM